MWKLAALGASAIVAGAVKFADHLAEMGRQATLQDFLAMRCGGEGSLQAQGAMSHDLMAQAAMHCWGCYAMAAGVSLIGFALWQSAWPDQARRRADR